MLTGVIAALPRRRRRSGCGGGGVLLHATAGDAPRGRGERGLIASDLFADLRVCVNPNRGTDARRRGRRPPRLGAALARALPDLAASALLLVLSAAISAAARRRSRAACCARSASRARSEARPTRWSSPMRPPQAHVHHLDLYRLAATGASSSRSACGPARAPGPCGGRMAGAGRGRARFSRRSGDARDNRLRPAPDAAARTGAGRAWLAAVRVPAEVPDVSG